MTLSDLADCHRLKLHRVLIGTAMETCELTDGNVLLRGNCVSRGRREDIDIRLDCLRPIDLVAARLLILILSLQTSLSLGLILSRMLFIFPYFRVVLC